MAAFGQAVASASSCASAEGRMNVLMVGSGSGSWEMRGRQLGAAIGARVTSTPSSQDFDWADVIVLVKRAVLKWRTSKPMIWDALDFWHQPAENGLTEPEALSRLAKQLGEVRPVLTIGATESMTADCDGAYLPHHSREGLVPTPAREIVRMVAYEGEPRYLGRWAGWVEAACRARGWQFVVNPSNLADADLIVAFRDGQWDGWMCREWKSGVKVVNAIAAGRPFISQASAAVRELQPAGSVVESEAALSEAFDAWTSLGARVSAVSRSEALAPRYTLAAVAAQYAAIVRDVAHGDLEAAG